MNIRNTLAVAALLVLCAAPSPAQQRPAPGQPGGPHADEAFAGPGRDDDAPSAGERREEIRRKMDAVRIMRLTESLRLDERTAAKFIPIITALEQKRRDLMRENQQAMSELRSAVASPSPDERTLKSAMERINRNHREMAKLRDGEIEAARENLTPEQQARYLLFQQDFMREMRGMIDGIRGGRGPGMRGGMGPGPQQRGRQY